MAIGNVIMLLLSPWMALCCECTLYTCCHSNYGLYLLFKVEDNCTDTAEALVKFTTQFEER